MQNDIIKVEAVHAFTLFPRKSTVLGEGDNTYGIVKWVVTDVLEGKPQTDKYNTITITGYYEETIKPEKIYTILAKEVEHEQYGVQYELLIIGEILNLESTSNQKAFLSTFLTEGQIEEIFKVFKNPLDIIKCGDIEKLKMVHGIGNYIANRIIERYEQNKDYCHVYIELSELGLTPKFYTKTNFQISKPQ